MKANVRASGDAGAREWEVTLKGVRMASESEYCEIADHIWAYHGGVWYCAVCDLYDEGDE